MASVAATQTLRAQGAAPADAAALEKAMAAVAREIEQIKAQLYQTVNTHYGEFVSTVKSTGDLNAKVSDVARTVKQLADSVDTTYAALTTNVIAPAIAIEHVKAQLATSDTLIAILKQLTQLHDLIQDVDGDLEIGEYVQAAKRVQQMTELVAALARHRENGVDATILQLVKNEYVVRKGKIKSTLHDLFVRAIVIRTTPHETEVVAETRIHGSLPGHDSAVPWTDVLAALDVLGSLQEQAATLCARLHAEVLLPLLRTPGATVAVRTVSKTSSALVVTFPRQSLVSGGTGAPPSAPGAAKRRTLLDPAGVETLMTACATVAQFVAQTVFPPAIRSRVPAELWWHPFSTAVVQEVLEVALPERADGLPAFMSSAVVAARTLEDRVVTLDLAAGTDRRLSDWSAQANVHFWEKRRTAALVVARELLAGSDHNTVQVTDATERGGLTAGGSADKAAAGSVPAHAKEGKETIDHTEGLFVLRTCHISARTQALVELIYQTLSECQTAEPLAAMQLYYSARDMLDLFRAVVPVYHASEIENVPLLAFVFVNDCTYIAHHLMTLGYQFQSYLPSPLKETATFVDMVPLFRRLAEHYYRLQMRKQEQQLTDYLAGAHGFADTHKDDRYEAVARALTQATLQLSLLAKVWLPALTTELYLASVGALVDVVLAAVVREIQALRDMSETETTQLHQLHQSLRTRIEPLFTARDAKAGTSKLEPAAKYCRQWDRFVVVDQLLTISLQDIPAQWEAGALRAFTAAEVRAMVLAVFNESSRREQTLRKLRD